MAHNFPSPTNGLVAMCLIWYSNSLTVHETKSQKRIVYSNLAQLHALLFGVAALNHSCSQPWMKRRDGTSKAQILLLLKFLRTHPERQADIPTSTSDATSISGLMYSVRLASTK